MFLKTFFLSNQWNHFGQIEGLRNKMILFDFEKNIPCFNYKLNSFIDTFASVHETRRRKGLHEDIHHDGWHYKMTWFFQAMRTSPFNCFALSICRGQKRPLVSGKQKCTSNRLQHFLDKLSGTHLSIIPTTTAICVCVGGGGSESK